jgi:hypothetical protein
MRSGGPASGTSLGAAAAAVGLLTILTGCSAAEPPDQSAAGRTASTFSSEAADAPEQACALLAPDTRRELEDESGPCTQALEEVGLPAAGRVLDVQVYGLDAMVRLEHDTLFLARFDAGWRVTAAGCTPQEPDRPYSCDVKGD